METVSEHNVQPKSIAEWLPELTNLLSQDVLASARKNPRKTAAAAAAFKTVEKPRPLTMAEIRDNLEALTGKKSCKKSAPAPKPTASIRRQWNSSVKVDKRISHTGEGQMRNNPVRKVLNFQQSRPQPPVPRHFNSETPKFPKPESRAKKSIHHLKAKEPRISGVYKMPETPVEVKKPIRSRLTMANKENLATRVPKRETILPRNLPAPKISVVRKQFLSPKPAKKHRVPDTPLSNDSWKSSCDASFLQKEKEIDDVEQKIAAITEQPTLEQIAEVSPPVSTPFKEYRNVQEYFNYSSEVEATLVEDNTIMCFEKTVQKVENYDDSVIVSLCDMLNKATVTHSGTEQPRTDLDILLEIKRETENNLKTQVRLLKNVNKLIQRKGSASTVKTIQQVSVSKLLVLSNDNITTSPILQRQSVIKSPIRSPIYKIPKRTPCLRKKVFHKSMPEMREKSPEVENDKALTMYMQMKEQMNFLNTPAKSSRPAVPDTPALTSKNLQWQLNKLFNGS